MNSKKAKTALIVTPLIAVFAIIIGVAFGSVSIEPLNVITVVLHKIFGTKLSSDFNQSTVAIIWELRLPRVMLAFLVGAALSASGAVIQSVLRNPLASPFTLGVSSGASLGAGLVIAFSISIPFLNNNFTLPLAGLLFGLATVLISIFFATRIDKNLQSTTIVLCGLVLSMFINAVFMLISSFSGDKMQQILKWQMGTFSSKGWDYVVIMFFVLIICIAIIMCFCQELDILTFGEEQAASIGVETKKVKWIMLIISSVLTGCAVAFAGIIGFVDLIVPQIVRRIFTAKHKYVIPFSALFGGIFMVVVDLIARTIISPSELPVGVVTALIGAPFFGYVFLKRRKC